MLAIDRDALFAEAREGKTTIPIRATAANGRTRVLGWAVRLGVVGLNWAGVVNATCYRPGDGARKAADTAPTAAAAEKQARAAVADGTLFDAFVLGQLEPLAAELAETWDVLGTARR